MIEYAHEIRMEENRRRAVLECRETEAALAELQKAEDLKNHDRLEAARLRNSGCFQDGA